MRRLSRFSAAFLLVPALACGAGGLGAAERLPLDLAVRIGYGPEPGSATLLDDVASSLVPELRVNGCFREVRPAPAEGIPAADVLMEVTLSEVREETRYEQSLAERAQPLDPAQTALGLASIFSLRVTLRLAAIPGGTVVREDGFTVRCERRPRSEGDDAVVGARTGALIDLAHRARKSVCRGSLSRLSRDIERARREP